TDVLAQENVEEVNPIPLDFAGDGELFMLRVRGDSMIDLGILDGDFIIAMQQTSANNGDIVVAGIPGDEATVKTYEQRGSNVVLIPANSTMNEMEFPSDDVSIFGRVVTVMRRL
ncbi:MAG: transcriptional repressor LexA, partial [Acidimicrobiaceae bacterium]